MKRERYVLATLCAITLLYIAVPKLPSLSTELPGTFTATWLLFALLVLGGNLSGLLYSPRRKRGTVVEVKQDLKLRRQRGM